MNERLTWRIVFLGILSLFFFASTIDGGWPAHQRRANTLRDWPPPEGRERWSAVAHEIDGATLFKGKSCPECHQLNGIGGALGPDLSHVGDRLPRQAIDDLLANPRSIDPRAVMPNPALLPPERAELARFLAGLRSSKVANR